MLFYEAPHKLTSTLSDLLTAFGPERRITLCRELTKLHEEIFRTTLGQAVERYRAEAPRGEFVLVVEGAAPRGEEDYTLADGLERVNLLLEQGLSRKDAVKQAAKELGLSRNDLYAAALSQ